MIVFDLDGTLADTSKRVKRYLIDPEKGFPHKRAKVDWDAFFLACDEDEPIIPTLTVLHALCETGHDVRIWTGRSDIARSKTETWLLMHGVPHHIVEDGLIMRRQNDYTNDDVLKYQWGQKYGMPDLVFEDRNRVVDMWRSHGVVVHHVAPGDF